MNDKIIQFYLDHADLTKQLGFKISSFVNDKYDYDFIEGCHGYIQWVFPTDKPSAYNPHAPIITETTIDMFKNCQSLRQTLSNAFFIYYLHLLNNEKKWLTKGNHNFLRITRILICLNLLSCKNIALSFYEYVEHLYENPEYKNIIGEETISFWRKASQYPN